MGKIYEALEKAERGQEGAKLQSHISSLDGLDPSNELVILNRPGSAIAEKFRFLRSKIIRPIEGSAPKTVLIASSLQAEGKTFMAANLAVAIAQGLDEHVLLIDADLRNPQMHRIFNLEDGNDKGLANHLSEGTKLSELLFKTSIDKLTILPAGMPPNNPAELLASQKMKALVAEVRDRYPDRVVIFDSPPMEFAPEALVMANEVDGIFLVVLRASTPRDVVRSNLEKIKQEKFQGIIFNADKQSSKAYKGGYNGYGYGYGQK